VISQPAAAAAADDDDDDDDIDNFCSLISVLQARHT